MTAIKKITLVRDFVHQMHENRSLDTWWTKKRIFLEIQQHIDNKDNDIDMTLDFTSVSKSKPKQREPQNYWGDDSDSDPDNDQLMTGERHQLSQPSEIDPMEINYNEKSEEIAKRSVEFYRKLIVNSIDYLNHPDQFPLVKELYSNGNTMLWVLDQMALTQYFAAVALRTGTVAGNNTASENGIKWTKYYVNPERNRIKEKRLNALNTIHEKILQDDLNENELQNSLQQMQICKVIIEGFDWTDTIPDIYNDLRKKIRTASKTQSKACM